MTTPWDVDATGFVLPDGLDDDASYDTVLNGRPVWSFSPGRDASGTGRRVVAWPKALRPFLVGRADVEIREHLSGEVAARAEVVFGDDAERELAVVDGTGRPLYIDKSGHLKKPLSEQAPEVREEMFAACHRILAVLEEFGVVGFIAYGTLLGAARNGHVIGHDNDIDLAYASAKTHPVDVVREAFGVERALRRAGFRVRRGMGARLNVRLEVSDGTVRGIDVFTAAWIEDVLYIPSDTGFRLPRSTVVPAQPISLEGETFPAPADPETLLAHTYGPTWRVPDPSFSYDTPRWLMRRLAGWYGGLTMHRKKWDFFYGQEARARVPRKPSPFATWVTEEFPSDRPVLDLGTGTGRDAVWFARQGRRAVGLDYAAGYRAARKRVASKPWDIEFADLNLYDTRAVLAWGTALARADEAVDLYARFLLPDLDPPGRRNLWRLASIALRRGGLLFLEFRTGLAPDGSRPPRARHVVELDDVVAQVRAAGGTIVTATSGTGLAPFEDEDPHVCRIVARWDDVVSDREVAAS